MKHTLHEGDCIEAMRLMEPGSIDAVVCDPPYSLGFMGKAWDSHTSPRAFQSWCRQWSAEALRVLKPGGHLVAFGGTRTHHRLASGIEDAGFEIRDTLAWLYGSGFPKSLDVSKAIDGRDAPALGQATSLEFTRWLRSTGITTRAIDAATDSQMASHYLTSRSQPAIPTAEHWALIRPLVPCEIPAWVDQLIGWRAKSENLERREVVSVKEGSRVEYAPGGERSGVRVPIAVTAPHTIEADIWKGWGTALKPAYEPIVLARKPLSGTVAENVLSHGVGAINIDACRIGGGEMRPMRGDKGREATQSIGAFAGREAWETSAGRWPANVMLDQEVAALLDDQTGTTKSTRARMALPRTPGDANGHSHGDTDRSSVRGHEDEGGASRFFYTSKASTRERNAGLHSLEEARSSKMMGADRDGELDDLSERFRPAPMANVHPTVKPLDVMRWLCRLVTPPHGVVLDPFTGSGTTGMAAIAEGFTFVGCEMDPEFLKIADTRIREAYVLAPT